MEVIKFKARDSYGYRGTFSTLHEAIDSLHAKHGFAERHLERLNHGDTIIRGNLHAWVVKVCERVPTEEKRIEEPRPPYAEVFDQILCELREEDPCAIVPTFSPREEESNALERPFNPSET